MNKELKTYFEKAVKLSQELNVRLQKYPNVPRKDKENIAYLTGFLEGGLEGVKEIK